MQIGDEVIKFGHIDSTNNQNLTALASLVSTNVNQEIEVWVQRGDVHVELQLKPQRWSGKGLLG